MPDPTIFGFPQSTYVRTVRLACEEKGVAYDLAPMGFSSDGLAELHPFRRIPAFRHGDVSLFEASSICRYVDAAFEGPALTPPDAAGAARMEQWISVINAYVDPPIIREIVIERITRPLQNRPADEEKCAAAKPRAAHALGIIDTALSKHDFLAGGEISLADFFLLPILYYFRQLPEGLEILPTLPHLGAWYRRMRNRASIIATTPPPPGER
jgi:glutathione S-transferase